MVRRSTLLLTAVLCAGVLSGCASSENDQAAWETMPKIDAHAHYTQDRDYLVPLLDRWKMRAVLVDIITDGTRSRWESMLALHEQHPDRFILCTTFDAARIDDPDFAQQAIAQLREDIASGARAVKVWKNIGLVVKDATGAFVQIDDARFQPIWDFLVEEGIPVLAHIGEPQAAWRPLDEKNPHYDYYAHNPQYHFLNRDDVPSWETVIEARDRWLERNPDLIVIGAHFGSLSHDVDEIAARLERFPHFYVEAAERFGDLTIQPREKVRAFFLQYHDRILYGTDLGTRRPQDALTDEQLVRERDQYVARRLRAHWEYLAADDSVEFVRTGTPFRVQTRGLGLPEEVLHDVYHRNAERLLDLAADS